MLFSDVSSHEECWICGSTPTTLCNVIPSCWEQPVDTTPKPSPEVFKFPELERRNLLHEKINPTNDNQIALCPTCQVNFDSNPPNVFFIPSDLDIFLDYWRKDETKRVPSRSQYLDELAKRHGTEYSRYTIYVVKEYRPRWGRSGSCGRDWNGLPCAAILKAMQILQKPVGLPVDVFRKLSELAYLWLVEDYGDQGSKDGFQTTLPLRERSLKKGSGSSEESATERSPSPYTTAIADGTVDGEESHHPKSPTAAPVDATDKYDSDLETDASSSLPSNKGASSKRNQTEACDDDDIEDIKYSRLPPSFTFQPNKTKSPGNQSGNVDPSVMQMNLNAAHLVVSMEFRDVSAQVTIPVNIKLPQPEPQPQPREKEQQGSKQQNPMDGYQWPPP